MQLARFQLMPSVARFLCDSRASCWHHWETVYPLINDDELLSLFRRRFVVVCLPSSGTPEGAAVTIMFRSVDAAANEEIYCDT